MAFVNEIPSAEDIERYDLPYRRDLGEPVEERRNWTADRERDFYLTGPSMTGNQAFEDNVKMYFLLYLSDSKFKIVMEDRTSSRFADSPYYIHWPALLSISTLRSQENKRGELPKVAWENPDTPQPLLNNYSFNQFVTIFKEALATRGAGNSNKHIKAPIIVSFGF